MQRLVSTRLLSPPQYKIPERDFLCVRESQEIAKVGAPSLSGQHGWYLICQLQNFRDGIRGVHDDDAYGQLMASMAKTLPDEQAVKDVSAYIAVPSSAYL